MSDFSDQTFIASVDMRWWIKFAASGVWPLTGKFRANLAKADDVAAGPPVAVAFAFSEDRGNLTRGQTDDTEQTIELNFAARADDIAGLFGEYLMFMSYVAADGAIALAATGKFILAGGV